MKDRAAAPGNKQKAEKVRTIAAADSAAAAKVPARFARSKSGKNPSLRRYAKISNPPKAVQKEKKLNVLSSDFRRSRRLVMDLAFVVVELITAVALLGVVCSQITVVQCVLTGKDWKQTTWLRGDKS